MRVLNGRLPVQTFVESDAQPGAWTELELLRDAAQRNEKTRTERLASGETVEVPVQETLREVESPEASAPRDNPLPLFICYAHANERIVKQLIPSLKVLARRSYIAPWRDTDLVAGEDWDETIKARLLEAEIVLYMVTRDFLASKYILEQERPLSMSQRANGKADVLPVLLRDCDCGGEDFDKLEVLPYKGKTLDSYQPHDKAWKLVQVGIQRAVERRRIRPL
jgi:hypothetical protein